MAGIKCTDIYYPTIYSSSSSSSSSTATQNKRKYTQYVQLIGNVLLIAANLDRLPYIYMPTNVVCVIHRTEGWCVLPLIPLACLWTPGCTTISCREYNPRLSFEIGLQNLLYFRTLVGPPGRTNVPILRSLQSWVVTIQSVELTADVSWIIFQNLKTHVSIVIIIMLAIRQCAVRSMIFNVDHSWLFRKKNTSETKGNPCTNIISLLLVPGMYVLFLLLLLFYFYYYYFYYHYYYYLLGMLNPMRDKK